LPFDEAKIAILLLYNIDEVIFSLLIAVPELLAVNAFSTCVDVIQPAEVDGVLEKNTAPFLKGHETVRGPAGAGIV
jgi:hypothetical protein